MKQPSTEGFLMLSGNVFAPLKKLIKKTLYLKLT